MFTKTLRDLREKVHTTQIMIHLPRHLMYVVTGDYDVFRYNGLFSLKLIFSLKPKIALQDLCSLGAQQTKNVL